MSSAGVSDLQASVCQSPVQDRDAAPRTTDRPCAPPWGPAWWIDPVVPAAPVPAPPPAIAAPRRPAEYRSRPQDATPTLFDEPDAEPAAAVPALDVQRSPVPAAVLKSAAYTAQKKIAGRVSVTDDQVRALLAALVAAPGQPLLPPPAPPAP